ncbi:ferritin [Bacillus fengqiuensis]|nr:ferritin [Bacillus fengqiuensis]
MISESMQKLVNNQLQVDLNSAYLYLAISNYFERMNLTGMARWLMAQYHEELTHAQILMKYLNDRDGVVEIRAIPAQEVNYGTPFQAFQKILGHEEGVTASYQKAYNQAVTEGDTQTADLMQQFLREQIDETAQSKIIVGRLQLNNNNPAGLLLLDQELGQRTNGVAAPGTAPAAPVAPPAG